MYDIRLARLDEVETLQSFIDEHWRKDHIFVQSKALLDWQHLDVENERYNFIVGVEKATGDFHGVLGFIPLSQFDPAIEADRLNWMAIWKVADAARGHRLGRGFMTYLAEDIGQKIISTVGASGMTLRMYEERGYQVGRMHQHYIINPEVSEHSLIDLASETAPSMDERAFEGSKRLRRITEAEMLTGEKPYFEAQTAVPKKTPTYIANRYFRHPLYKYDVFEITDSGSAIGLIALRACTAAGGNALRMVEFIGPESALAGLGAGFLEILAQTGAEYVDFYSAGIDMDALATAGFTHREEDDKITVPNYFEPFLRKNVEIYYMISTKAGQKFRMVKGDSDQDRPNSLETGV